LHYILLSGKCKKMKRLFFLSILILSGCYEHIPDGVKAQMAAENFLDTLYRPNKVRDKIGLNYITVKEYLNLTKRKIFQKDSTYYHLSTNEWLLFTKKINHILSRDNEKIKGTIEIEGYTVNHVKYTTAFFVDSRYRKVFAVISLN
jgi:hypothetical protein